MFTRVFLVACAAVAASASPIINNVRITQASSLARNPVQDIMQLNKAENCGYSTVHDIRLEHCNTAPCTFIRGHIYSISVDFTTRAERCNPFFRAILAYRSEIEVLQDDLYLAPDVRLEGNTRYTFTYDFTIPDQGWTGDHAEFRFKVYQNMVAELCIVIPSNIIYGSK